MLTLATALQAERDRRPGVQPKKVHRHQHMAKRVVKFECLPAQYDFLTDRDTHSLIAVGGIGAGKTVSLMAYVGGKMGREAGRGTLGGIFANTYEQLNQSTLPKLWQLFERMDFQHGRDYVYNCAPPRHWRGFQSQFRKHNNILSVRHWGQAITRSLENYEDIRGVELGWAATDELRGSVLEAFKVVLGRLRCPRCTHIEYRAVTSPNGFDWIYDEFMERPARDTDLNRRIIHMRTADNVYLGEEYVRTLIAAYDERTAKQELEGLFVSLTTGTVYHQFKRAVHVQGVVQPINGLNWQICFDFNRTPFSVVLCQTFRDDYGNDIVWAVDELSLDDCDTATMCKEIFERLEGYDDRCLIEVFGDPSGKQRTTKSNDSDYDIITAMFGKRYGDRFVRCWREDAPAVMARINAVNTMLRNAAGLVRLFISPKCTLLRRDFERVMYKKGTRDINKTGEENKLLTHLSDALGYFIEERYPVRGGPRAGFVML